MGCQELRCLREHVIVKVFQELCFLRQDLHASQLSPECLLAGMKHDLLQALRAGKQEEGNGDDEILFPGKAGDMESLGEIALPVAAVFEQQREKGEKMSFPRAIVTFQKAAGAVGVFQALEKS